MRAVDQRNPMKETHEMDGIDEEIDALKARWEKEERERKQRVADAQMVSLEKMRDRLRAGEWDMRHSCRCAQCLRAVLTCQPELVCEDGKRADNWWGTGPRKPLPRQP